MRRRTFLTMVPAATVALAGCSGDGGSDASSTDSADESAPSSQDSPETEPTTPTFEADITYPSCTSVRVEADSYGTVLALVSDGSNVVFDEGYSGANTFETDLPIEETLVYGEDGNDSAPNPDYESCTE